MFDDTGDHPIILNISMETIQNFLFGRKLNTLHEPAALKCKL